MPFGGKYTVDEVMSVRENHCVFSFMFTGCSDTTPEVPGSRVGPQAADARILVACQPFRRGKRFGCLSGMNGPKENAV